MAFVPKTWVENDPITPAELNRIEAGVYGVALSWDAALTGWADDGGAVGEEVFPARGWFYALVTASPGTVYVYVRGVSATLVVVPAYTVSGVAGRIIGPLYADGTNVAFKRTAAGGADESVRLAYIQ